MLTFVSFVANSSNINTNDEMANMSQILDKTYVVSSYNNKVYNPLSGGKAHIKFSYDNDKLIASGNSSCNAFRGTVVLNGNRFSLKHIMSTQKMCANDNSNIERKLLNTLKNDSLFYKTENGFELVGVDDDFIFSEM